MNPRLKNILHNAWTEPRHFFFWLALFSAVGFVGLATAAALSSRPALAVEYLLLGLLLIFLLSLLAFVLAWIPPVRPLLGWLLGRRFLVLGGLVTLVALFYAVEDWRGHRAWHAFKQECEAEGEHFGIAGLAPPPVPADQNFFETPLWQDMHFVQTNGVTLWSDTNWGNHVIFDIYAPSGREALRIDAWRKGQHVDLTGWQAYYRGSNNLFDAQNGPATNYFPVAKEPQEPAADVLLALSRFESNRQILIEAAARPAARFWLNYDAGFGMLLPHLARLKATASYLSLHAVAALHTGNRAEALEDLKLEFRVIEALRHEPTLISQLVRIAMTEVALQPVWEGLAGRQWTEPDLRAIEGTVGKLDFLADYEFGMRAERACDLWAVDYVRKEGISGLDGVFSHDSTSAGDELGRALSEAFLRTMPAGWFDQNKLSLCDLYERYLFPVVDDKRRLVSPASAIEFEAAIAGQRMRPFDFLSRRLMPALAQSAERFAHAQAAVNLACVACALERYRLAKGEFPSTLEALTPDYLQTLPHDIINGQPLKYQRTADGQFVLYSVGWNTVDDGARIVLNKNGGVDVAQGDWVWRYPSRGS